MMEGILGAGDLKGTAGRSVVHVLKERLEVLWKEWNT